MTGIVLPERRVNDQLDQGKPPSRRGRRRHPRGAQTRIAEMDTGASLFLSHRDPAVVSQPGNLRFD